MATVSTSSLPATSSVGGAQASTQDPQSATGANGFGGESSSSVQPGTSTSVLENQGGTQLGSVALQPIPIPTSSATEQTAPVTTTRHANIGLISLAVVLFVVAIALFVANARAEKSTT